MLQQKVTKEVKKYYLKKLNRKTTKLDKNRNYLSSSFSRKNVVAP